MKKNSCCSYTGFYADVRGKKKGMYEGKIGVGYGRG